jgi:magnesium chelatase family protein
MTDYQARISGPLMDRIDIRIDVLAVSAVDLIRPMPAERSADVARRVGRARDIQRSGFEAAGLGGVGTNARCSTAMIEKLRRARTCRPAIAPRRGRENEVFGAGLPSCTEGGAHSRGSRR